MKEQYNVLYGGEANKERVCAYCKMHRKNLTVRQLHKKECLQKQCTHLQKYEHPFWEYREERKKLRQERKKRINGFFEKTTTNVT